MRGFCLVAALAAACSAAACRGPEDCSMLGECVAGKCVCDRGFTGDGCDLFDLGAAPAAGAVQFENSTWGGHPVFLEGRWHMYVSDVGPCGLHRFKSFSRIIHVSADNVEGPYKYEDVAVPGVAHNAYPVVTAEGQLLVYYIGVEFNPGSLSCDVAKAPEMPSNGTGIINVAESVSGSPSGPWRYHTNILGGFCPAEVAWCQSVSNPAPYQLSDGRWLMGFHGKDPVNNLEDPGMAVGDSFRGPFSLLNKAPIFAKPAPYYNISTGALMPPAEFHGEDFFLWKGRRAYHMVWHSKEPFVTRKSGDATSCGSMAWSTDGKAWTPTPHRAYNGTPQWASSPNPGALSSRQRPQIIFTDPADPHRPTHLFNGVQKCPKGTVGAKDYAWTVVTRFN